MFLIYEIQNKINGQKYIGCTKQINRRWKEHKIALNNNKHKNPKLQAAWNYYGEESFQFIVIETLETETDMFDREAILIEGGINLYNITDGGYGGDRFTNNPNKEDYRDKLSKAQIKRYSNPSERLKSNVFKNLTPEQLIERKKVWSKAQTGKNNSRFKWDIPVLQIDLNTNEVIKEYEYPRLVNEDGFVSKYVINCCLNKKSFNKHKGYIWKFKK
jgi:group I intron endonuclease